MSWEAQTLGQILERHARERGNVEALVTQKRRFTYEDLYLRSRSAAATLVPVEPPISSPSRRAISRAT